MKCLHEDDDCGGVVLLRPAPSGSGAVYERCEEHQRIIQERVDAVHKRYPDNPIAPDWFDPTYAGERWNEDD